MNEWTTAEFQYCDEMMCSKLSTVLKIIVSMYM